MENIKNGFRKVVKKPLVFFGLVHPLIYILLLLLLVWFYWFQWRPVSIKKACSKSATEFALLESGTRYSANPLDNYDKRFELRYENCLKQKGL